MTLQDACSLAVAIDASGRAELITIGRFLPLDMITAESPWGCAVRQPDGTLQTVWSAQDWVDLQRIRGGEPCEPTALAAGEPGERAPYLDPDTDTPAIPATTERSAGGSQIPNTPAASAVGSQKPETPQRRDAKHLRQPSLF